MDSTNKHIGFKEDTPETVIWSDTSFVKAVHTTDQRKHGWSELISAFIPLVALVLSMAVLCSTKIGSKYFPSLGPSFFVALSAVIFIPGLLILALRSFLIKKFMIFKISSRSELLFEPDNNCTYIAIEDPLTYDKRKLLPEDFGLLNITPEFIQLEMLNHLAQFDLNNLTFSLLHVGQNIACVRLSCDMASHPWSIAITAQALPGKIIDMAQSASKAKRLFKLLENAGIQKAGKPQRKTIDPACQSEEQPEVSSETSDSTNAPMENDDIMDIRYQNVVNAIRQKEKKRS